MLTKVQLYNSEFCGSNITKLRSKNCETVKKTVVNLREMSALKNLSDNNISLLKNVFIESIADANAFFSTISGIKPAAIITSFAGNMEFLNNIPNFDFIHERKYGYNNSFIINKKAVMQIIEKNKGIFTSRLNLAPETPTEVVYRVNRNNLFNRANHDLIGITLGYPPIDCMIFQLGIFSGLNKQKTPLSHYLLHKLYAQDSVYKNLDKETFEQLDRAIRNLKKPKVSRYLSHVYMQYTGKNKEIAARDESYLSLSSQQLLSDF